MYFVPSAHLPLKRKEKRVVLDMLDRLCLDPGNVLRLAGLFVLSMHSPGTGDSKA
jgi:hypothetical protein